MVKDGFIRKTQSGKIKWNRKYLWSGRNTSSWNKCDVIKIKKEVKTSDANELPAHQGPLICESTMIKPHSIAMWRTYDSHRGVWGLGGWLRINQLCHLRQILCRMTNRTYEHILKNETKLLGYYPNYLWLNDMDSFFGPLWLTTSQSFWIESFFT